MRAQTCFSFLILPFALAACNGGMRKYEPLKRAPVADTPAPTQTKNEETPSAPTHPTGPAAELKDLVDPSAITTGAWCTVRKTDVGFIVDRYVFDADDAKSTALTQITLNPKQMPVVSAPRTLPPWSEVSDSRKHTDSSRVGVEVLSAEVAQASPAFEDQGQLFNRLAEKVHIEVSPDPLGEDGAVRLSRPGREEQILFSCQNYSSTFEALGANQPAAAPRSVEPAERGTKAGLVGPLKAIPTEQINLGQTRWCSHTPTKDDFIVGMLQFGTAKDVTLNHLRASALKERTLARKEFAKAALHAADQDLLTGATESSVSTKQGRSYRFVEDAGQRRAIILDKARGAAPPMTIAEVFFECGSENDPIQNAQVTQNLTTFASFKTAK